MSLMYQIAVTLGHPMGCIEKSRLGVSVENGNVWIRYSKMYEPPPINLDTLLALGDIFGTKSVDVDDYAQSGCETCDWGSDYGHNIEIKKPTKNVDELKSELASKPKEQSQ